MIIYWSFLDREADVISLHSNQVAYSWTCREKSDLIHIHTIECLWVWHKCDMNLDMERVKHATRTDDVIGWKPTGVSAHDLISSNPLHIEASVYWPDCCGLHGFIRDGRWASV